MASMPEISEVFAANSSRADLESLRGRLTAATCRLSQHLATQRRACLAQIWVPDAAQDGSVTLHTQGVPFCVAGCGDLLALFRCVSCRYKFGTDSSKPALMGSVGRVFMSGKPEMAHNVQQHDKSQFLRVDEAQRCRVHSALFMPLYTSTARRHPFGVFEVVQADTDVLFPVLVQRLKCCLQEVQLYTAEPYQNALTMGLCAPTMSPASASPQPLNNSQQPHKQAPSATMTHCSASSLHVHRHMKGSNQQHKSPLLASNGVNPVGRPRIHEVSADSEEEKTSSSVGRGSRSPETSSAPSGLGGPCGASICKQEGSGELQSVSRGSFATPAPTPAQTPAQISAPTPAPMPAQTPAQMSAATGLPAQLVAIGKTLQLQTSAAPTDFQTPFPESHTSVPAVASSVSTAAAMQSPFMQQQQQQLQHHQRQQQLQFLANALQLQSQLKAHTQSRPGVPAAGGSAFAGYQPFSPTVPTPQLTNLVQQHSAPVPQGEEDAADEEVQINNRVAGGAGKRLSVEDLQSQFGVGLREAAHNLRICPTTLKRACRRHGIYRWPRRQSWGGGAGDEGRTESMNLDGDVASPAGLLAGSEVQGAAAPTPATGEQGLPGLLSSCSSGLLAFQTPFAGQGQGPLQEQLTGLSPGQVPGQSHGQSALEGFQHLDSSAQIAVLQRLTAAKAGAADNQWLQGSALSTSLKPPGSLSQAPAVNTSAATGLTAPARQFGTGMVASMLATGLDHTPTPQLHLPPASSQPSNIIARQAAHMGKANVLPHSGMLRQHSATSHPIRPAFASQHSPHPFLGRQGCALGQPQGTGQQGIFQQGLSQQAAHMSSGLFQQPGPLPAALSGNSSFTSLPPSLAPVTQPGVSVPWQHQSQSQTQAQTVGMMQAASMLSQESHMPAACRGGVPQPPTKLPPSALPGDNPSLQDASARLELPPSSMKTGSDFQNMGCNVIDNIGLETPTDVESGSGQGSAAMEFEVSDHGLGSLDFLGEAGLDLDHSGALDFDPEDCMF